MKQPALPRTARKALRASMGSSTASRARHLRSFDVDVRALAGGGDLRASAYVEGWRSIGAGPEGPRTVEVRRRGGPYRFAAENVGVFSQRLAGTLAEAEARLKDQAGTYEPCVLDVDGLQVAAIWFRHAGGRDLLMALPAANCPFEAGELYAAEEFTAILRDMARRRLETPDPR